MTANHLSLAELHRRLVYIRQAESLLVRLYKEQEMRTPTHFGLGQEAVAVGVCAALQQGDVVYTHHRSHNHYLAQGGDFFGLASELYGRRSGCSEGRGGSVHLTARDKGFVASSAILGQMVAVAAGSALSFKMDGEPRVAVTFFGDATCEEGVFYETLNYSATHALPVLLVCENNLYSTESPLSVRQPTGNDLCARARAFGVDARSIDGNDVEIVHETTRELLGALRSGKGPAFLECNTYRWLEHVGPNFDHELGRTYRTEAEVRAWMERCPVKRSGARLIDRGISSESDLARIQTAIDAELEIAAKRARQQPMPDASELFQHIW